MIDLLFDVPWWIPTLLAVVGLALLVSGNRRQDDRTRNGGFSLIAIAIGWSIMSYLVDTPKETCQKQTRQFVQSVIDRQWSTFDGLLDPSATFEMPGTDLKLEGRETIDQAIKPDVQYVGVKSAHITDMKAADAVGNIRITMTVWSTQEKTMDQPLDSDWEFDWRKSDGRWLLYDIRCLRISNVTADEARNSLPVHNSR